jgi:fluoroquinolone transport system ATP-binding protein
MIDVQELRYAYPGQDGDTIRGISFSITAGEIFGFLGPSGSGKEHYSEIVDRTAA